MTSEAMRRRTITQIALLIAAFLVLVAISVSSILLVNRAREDNAWVIHTVEVQNRISNLLLEVRRAESAARGYMLTQQQRHLDDYQQAFAAIMPLMGELERNAKDNPTQVENAKRLRAVLETRMDEFKRAVDFVQSGDGASALAMARDTNISQTAAKVREYAQIMHAEEARLFAERTVSADRSQQLATLVTTAGSGLVVLFGIIAIVLLRISARARDRAEEQLRDTNLNLESLVDERTADLTEANEEIQRFAYIVSHDLRSPLVNIMGFTSELEELRGDIFRRIATLSRPAGAESASGEEPQLQGDDNRLASEFSEALGFIKSSIGKMDRLISAILNLTREGRREFKPERIDTTKLIETIVETVAHQAQEAKATITVEKLPDVLSDRLALEQIFGNLIDNALKYLRDGVPGEIVVRGKTKLGFAVFEVTDNGRGVDPKDHQRIFELFRRAGVQDRPGQGIGLAHVRALIRRLGGTMAINSALDAGSTFIVTLPIKWTGANRDTQA